MLRKAKIIRTCFLLVAAMLVFRSETMAVPIPGTVLDSLGGAGQYTVLSLTGTFQNQSNVTIFGDVGVGPNGSASVMAPSTVHGTIFKDPTAKVSGPGGITGGIVTADLHQAMTDAVNASTAFNNLAATQIFSSISAAKTITGNGGMNVIDLSGGINLSGSNNLTLSGGANDKFIFNIQGGLSMGGSARVVLTGSVNPENVLFNFIGSGNSLMTHVGNQIMGIVLAPNRAITFHGVFGEVIGGGKSLTLMSGAIVTGFGFGGGGGGNNVPDSSSTLILGCLALGALAVTRRFVPA